MIVPILALHGILLVSTQFVKTTNNFIDHQVSTRKSSSGSSSSSDLLWLDVLAPIDIVFEYITNYDHLRQQHTFHETREKKKKRLQGLKAWLSNYKPPEKISRRNRRRDVVETNNHENDDDVPSPHQRHHVSCLVAKTIQLTSVDTIMERLAPTKSGGIGPPLDKGRQENHAAINLAYRRSRGVPVPYNVCMEWTAFPHPDKPQKWTQVSLAMYVSRIGKWDINSKTEIRLALVENEVKPEKIAIWILGLILDHKIDTLTAVSATIMRWVKQVSEREYEDEEEDSKAGGNSRFKTMTSTVVKWLKDPTPGATKLEHLSQEAQEAIKSNHVISQMAQTVLDEIERDIFSIDDMGSPAKSADLGATGKFSNSKEENFSNQSSSSLSREGLENVVNNSDATNNDATTTILRNSQPDLEAQMPGQANHESFQQPELDSPIEVLDEAYSDQGQKEEGTIDKPMQGLNDADAKGQDLAKEESPRENDFEYGNGKVSKANNENNNLPYEVISPPPSAKTDTKGSLYETDSNPSDMPLNSDSTSSDTLPTNQKHKPGTPSGEVSSSQDNDKFHQQSLATATTTVNADEAGASIDVAPGTLDVSTQVEKPHRRGRRRFFLVATVCFLCLLNVYICLTR